MRAILYIYIGEVENGDLTLFFECVILQSSS
uniref:Uncharacterized protein n=1 Tax=Myoviridae sp. ctZgq1 TaxID=2826666 RepID=A0A8S5LXB0_9CAUD|nr:MAG TPA: hypothetical protein [Myoviridae sp. ctZgq1]